MTKFKIWNNTICVDQYSIIGFSKYFNEFEIFDQEEFVNHRVNVLLDLIGKYEAEDSKGKSHRHKGIQKVQEVCEKDFDIIVSKTEIKSLLRSQTRTNIFGAKKRSLKCPYNMDYILKTIIKISSNNSKIKEVFNRIFTYNKGLTFEENCYSFLLGKFYASLKQKLQKINLSIDEKGNKLYFESVESKLLRLKKSLNESFKGKCELIQ